MNFSKRLVCALLLLASSAQAVEPITEPAVEPNGELTAELTAKPIVKSVCMPAYRETINRLSCKLASFDRRFMSPEQSEDCERRQSNRIFLGSVASGAALMWIFGGPVGGVSFEALFLIGAGGFFTYRTIRREVIIKMIHGLESTYFMLEEAFASGDGIYLRKAYRNVIGERLDMTEMTYEEFVAKIKALDATGAICGGGVTFSQAYVSRKMRKGKL